MPRHRPLEDNDPWWSQDRKRYAIWLATPTMQRKPRSKSGFARAIGMSRMALSRWEKKPGFMEYVDDLGVGHLRKRLANIYKAIGDKAEAGDMVAAKLALDVVRDEVNKKIVEHEGGPAAATQSDEELAAQLHRLLKKGTMAERIPDREEFIQRMTKQSAPPPERSKTVGKA